MKRILLMFAGIYMSLTSIYSQAPQVSCATAGLSPLTVNGGCGSGTLTANTLETGISSTNICGSGQAINSREGWYAFVATASSVNVTASASNRNLTLQVFSGICGALTEIGCANSITTTSAQTESISLSGLTIGQTYYVRVGNITANDMTLTSLCITSAPPPANDNPCTAQPLSGGGACSYYTGTNAFATATTGPPAPGCGGYSGGDVWFTAVVPASGNITFDSQTGVMTDGSMAVYSGTCGSLTLLACDADASSNGLMPMISLTGQTPGATLYIRMWENGNDQNGTFGICSYDPTTPSTNCNGAIGVCNTASFAGNAAGFGNQELNGTNGGCLTAFEHQTTWFGFSPAMPGTIQLNISPTAGSVDYDFAIWGPYAPGSGCPVTSSPLRCSFSAVLGPTGLSTGAGDLTENALGDSYVESIVIGAGQVGMVYYLVVDNYTANTTPFTLTWGLAPSNMLDCTPPLPIELALFNGEATGTRNRIYWNTLTETNCSHFIIEKSLNGIYYEDLGRVEGHGTVNSPQSYELYDNNPSLTTYYKIRQTDFNGDADTYGPIVITNTDVNKFSVGNIYPNPNDGRFFVDIYSQESSSTNILITSSLGSVIYNKEITTEGSLQFELGDGNLLAGMYLVTISNEKYQYKETKRVVIN